MCKDDYTKASNTISTFIVVSKAIEKVPFITRFALIFQPVMLITSLARRKFKLMVLIINSQSMETIAIGWQLHSTLFNNKRVTII